MDGFFFDSISRFSDSARAWTLDFGGALAGATIGANLAHPGSMSGATSAQRDLGVDLTGLSDMVWEAGSDAIITLGFTGASNSGSGGGQELVVDNIGITVVPEPSSTLLAGLAGLGLLVTHRRPGSVPVAS